ITHSESIARCIVQQDYARAIDVSVVSKPFIWNHSKAYYDRSIHAAQKIGDSAWLFPQHIAEDRHRNSLFCRQCSQVPKLESERFLSHFHAEPLSDSLRSRGQRRGGGRALLSSGPVGRQEDFQECAPAAYRHRIAG